ncbi:MAG: prevent-host-death family protein [Firmicutes bacterium]|nr:prevent-host-death family protein [Bacillota bacterium]
MATPVIRQVSDMRKPDEIKEICSRNTPVFVLKNGEVHFVAISQDQFEDYENLKARRELRAQLAIAEVENRTGAPTIEHKEFMGILRKKIHGDKTI